MLSVTSFSIAGHTFTISAYQLLIAAGVLLVIAAVLLAFGRNRAVVMKRSAATDELYMQLGRIADAMERLANQSSDRIIAERSQRVEAERSQRIEAPAPPPPPPLPPKLNEEPQPHTVAYSMFGR
jgi:hypothetical protein